MSRSSEGALAPGHDAKKPTQIPAKGWFQILKRAWGEAKTDMVPLLGAGVAFKAFLALFPALTAAFLIWQLVSDPAEIKAQIEALGPAIPDAARQIVVTQSETIAQNKAAAGWSLAFAVAIALWSASSGVQNMMDAINAAYDEQETRGFIKQKATALALTVGAIVVFLLAIALVAILPPVLDAVGLSGTALGFLVAAVRWVLLVAILMTALGVLYRVAPDRDAPQFKWTSTGAIIATALFIVASIGFTLYMSVLGQSSYTKNYGASAGVVILLVWLWITSYAILLGAEVNAESERQTAEDTTQGEPQPMGDRDALAADTVANADGSIDLRDDQPLSATADRRMEEKSRGRS
ncbi:membrane protein [Kineococcus xinjiangensis]|uniref:Membrane protein n=1 Tax=Kineococcus xinjiangensis TaxID=512762 RepID=A0A2S6IT66_9ACTN|nr:YihY/virulence factor BrkB family protein [Kineococcus xinjiangensis]PPK97443.1 membrane protein [Kineococcus xinjiangensis]